MIFVVSHMLQNSDLCIYNISNRYVWSTLKVTTIYYSTALKRMSVLSSSSQPRNYLNKNKSQKSQKLQPLTFLSLSGFYQQNTHEKISNHNLQGYSFFIVLFFLLNNIKHNTTTLWNFGNDLWKWCVKSYGMLYGNHRPVICFPSIMISAFCSSCYVSCSSRFVHTLLPKSSLKYVRKLPVVL